MKRNDMAAYQEALSVAAEAARYAQSGDRVTALAGLDEVARRLSSLWPEAGRAKDRRAIALDLGDVLLNAGRSVSSSGTISVVPSRTSGRPRPPTNECRNSPCAASAGAGFLM
jgi:hypothetical protein